MCKSKSKKKNKNVNRVTKSEQSKGGADTSENSLDSAHAFVIKSRVMESDKIVVNVGGVAMTFIIDSGSDCNILKP